jgi:hypothetical protein
LCLNELRQIDVLDPISLLLIKFRCIIFRRFNFQTRS